MHPLRAKVHLVSTIKIVKRGGGLAGLIDSGPFARQSRRTESLEARQAGPNRACFFLFFCPQIGVTLNSPGRLFQPSLDLLFFNTTRSRGLNPSGLLSGFCFNKPDLLCLMIHKILELYLRKKVVKFCIISLIALIPIPQLCTAEISLMFTDCRINPAHFSVMLFRITQHFH